MSVIGAYILCAGQKRRKNFFWNFFREKSEFSFFFVIYVPYRMDEEQSPESGPFGRDLVMYDRKCPGRTRIVMVQQVMPE